MSKDGKTLTIKEGSYDRLYYSITTDSLNPDNVTQLPSWSAGGGVTVKNGILYAKKATKPAAKTAATGKPAAKAAAKKTTGKKNGKK